MCGIAGFVNDVRENPGPMTAMLEALKQRGPDANRMVSWNAGWQRDAVKPRHALLHTRLAIRDLRPVAGQPMSNQEQDIWICYNGEVYGWENDAESLRAAGYHFRSHSDTEFILHAYTAWGIEALLPRLRGMFALAILDLRRKKLWVVRDRLGLKPVVYYHEGHTFAFASTVRSLLPFLPAAQRQFSPDAIDAYLAHRYIPAPHTIFTHMQRLENGHYLGVDLTTGEVQKISYWHPVPSKQDILQTLGQSIALRTVADRPVGLFLSSGVDSTVLASRLAQMGYRQISAFTAAFPNTVMDESEAAAGIAARLKLPHQKIIVPQTIREDFARIIADLDEPFADPSSFPTWYLARETTQHAKVVLNGDGGDELFAGYKRYKQHMRLAGIRRLISGHPLFTPKPDLFNRHKNRLELSMSWLDAYALRFSGFSLSQRQVLQPGFSARPQYWRAVNSRARKGLSALLEIDYANYLPEYILRKTDLMTMAHGIEAREPLLDQEVVCAVFALSDKQRFTVPAKKIFAPVCAGLGELSPFQHQKRGFNPPLRTWLMQDLAERYHRLGQRLAELTGHQLSAEKVDRFVKAYLEGHGQWAEEVLQLLILDESLQQLKELSACV